MTEFKSKVQVGTKITCPICEAPQLQATQEIKPGGQMKDANWESLGFDMDQHSMTCYKCGQFWARRHPKTSENQIHIEEHGWIPTSTKKPLSS